MEFPFLPLTAPHGAALGKPRIGGRRVVQPGGSLPVGPTGREPGDPTGPEDGSSPRRSSPAGGPDGAYAVHSEAPASLGMVPQGRTATPEA